MRRLIIDGSRVCPCCGRLQPPLPLRESGETAEECRQRMQADPASPLNEYGEEWPDIKAFEQALILRSHFWWVAGDEEKSAAAQRELWEFWKSPRPLELRLNKQHRGN